MESSGSQSRDHRQVRAGTNASLKKGEERVDEEDTVQARSVRKAVGGLKAEATEGLMSPMGKSSAASERRQLSLLKVVSRREGRTTASVLFDRRRRTRRGEGRERGCLCFGPRRGGYGWDELG
jgi:hypothetical protein